MKEDRPVTKLTFGRGAHRDEPSVSAVFCCGKFALKTEGYKPGEMAWW